jgi:putative lipoic acid-binding regulatory protein
MGYWSSALEDRISTIVGRHIGDQEIFSTRSRLSREGRYIAITCVIEANSRAQLDAIYMDLNSEPDVLMTL